MRFLEELCQKFLNQPKIKYSAYDIGSVLSTSGRRHDFMIKNKKGLKIHASFYESNKQNKENKEKICIVYLHSMNGSRLESTIYTEDILSMGYCFCNFDFSGCGNSEGEIISFGANQKHDVDVIINAVIKKFHVNKFILWGRSMGSVAAIKYCELIQNQQIQNQSQSILGLILDSCFKSFDQLAIQIANKSSKVPQLLIKIGYFIIKGTLQQKGEFKVQQLQLEQIVKTLYIPMLFLASPEDVTVSIQHSQKLFKACKHPNKKLSEIKGLHNESRDQFYLSSVKNYIENIIFDHYNTKKLKLSPSLEHKYNKYQMMAFHKQNFTFQSQEYASTNDQCSCSLFPSSIKQNTFNNDFLPITGRKTQYIEQRQNRRMSRNSSRQFNFRSTQKLSPFSSNML